MSPTNRTFADFYQFYLTEHSKRTTKILHFVGTLLVLTVLAIALWTANWWFLVWIPIFGYGFAWIGHFFFERNKPASFSEPLYSLAADFVMFKDILTGRVRL